MSQSTCDVCAIVAESNPSLLLAESDHWQIYLSNQQNYPGRCFVPLKRHAESLGELTSEEWGELQIILRALETVLRKKLGASHANFSCLMNGAYGVEPPSPHVHFHVIPRYSHPVTFGGMRFKDELYGLHYSTKYDWVLNEAGAQEIKRLIQDELQEGPTCC